MEETNEVDALKVPVLSGTQLTVILDHETIGTIGPFGSSTDTIHILAIQICVLKKENLVLQERLKKLEKIEKDNPSICSRWS